MKKAGIFSLIFIALVVIGMLAFKRQPAPNNEITPSHVYQKTEYILARLAQYGAAEGIAPRTLPYWPENRQPRHVLMETRTLLLRLDRWAEMKGQKSATTPVFKSMVVTPANVLEQMNNLDGQIAALAAQYDVAASPQKPPFREGYVPADVFRNVLKIALWLDALGVPELEPSDVHQLARTMNSSLASICQHLKAYCPTDLPPRKDGLEPSDVYGKARLVFEHLRVLAASTTPSVQGGIVIPTARVGAKIPAHVHALVGQMQADIGALQLAVGLTDPTVMEPRINGMTPSDVYQQMEHAQAILTALISHNRMGSQGRILGPSD